MKEKIMEKLFSNQELSSDELIFIGRNLQDSSSNTLGYDHSNENTLQACNVSEEDFNSLNEVMKTQIEEKKDSFKGSSEIIEKLEEIAISNPKFLRIIMMNHIRLMFQSQHPLLGLLLGMGGKR